MAPRKPDPPPAEPHVFRSIEEIDTGIRKIERRIAELKAIDIPSALRDSTGADDVAISNVRETIREIFGTNSPEFRQHQNIKLWVGPMFLNMDFGSIVHATEQGRTHVVGILEGLIGRLTEKREDLPGGSSPDPNGYFDSLNLHSRISDVSRDLFFNGHHWEAVFAASKALVNFVKERSGIYDIDGAPLVRKVFSRNNPVLRFSDLRDQTDQDEQEGMMHLYEGAILGIRNPGSHSFPTGTRQRAIEYLSLLSMLAYRLQETRK